MHVAHQVSLCIPSQKGKGVGDFGHHDLGIATEPLMVGVHTVFMLDVSWVALLKTIQRTSVARLERESRSC